MLLCYLEFNMILYYLCIQRWWKDLKLVERLSFARDRCVECYTWALGIYFEPKYSLGRTIITKIVVITSVMDDIYDLYATFEELQLFTRAIERFGSIFGLITL